MSRNKKRAAIYCRISDDRAGRGLGVARQERECRELAERRGWTVVAVFTDNDISAYTRKPRPGYRAMLDALADVHVVVVFAADRLTRHPAELEELIEELERHAVDVAPVTGGERDLTTPDGRLVARIEGAVARRESEGKAARIRSKQRELAEAGKPRGGGPRPYGYERNGIDVAPAEAEIIREAARRVLTGESVRSIVVDLTERGVPTVAGGRWTSSQLKATLIRPRNAGLLERNGRLSPACWQPILDEVTYKRVVAVLTDPRRSNMGRGRPMRLLTGLAECSLCGQPLKSQPRNGEGAYGCRREVGSGCGGVSIGAALLEGLIVPAVIARLDVEALQATAAVVEPDDSAERIELDRLTLRRSELDADRALGDLRTADYARLIDVVDRREAELRTIITDRVVEAAPVALVADLGLVGMDWTELTVGRQRAVIGAVIERIIVSPAPRGRRGFDPSRVTVTWRA